MSVNPETYTPFLTTDRDRALFSRRQRRDRFGRAIVLAGTTVVLVALLAIPLFLVASLLSPTPLPPGSWSRLGTLLAGTAKAATCALLVAVPLGLAAAIFTA